MTVQAMGIVPNKFRYSWCLVMMEGAMELRER